LKILSAFLEKRLVSSSYTALFNNKRLRHFSSKQRQTALTQPPPLLPFFECDNLARTKLALKTKANGRQYQSVHILYLIFPFSSIILLDTLLFMNGKQWSQTQVVKKKEEKEHGTDPPVNRTPRDCWENISGPSVRWVLLMVESIPPPHGVASAGGPPALVPWRVTTLEEPPPIRTGDSLDLKAPKSYRHVPSGELCSL